MVRDKVVCERWYVTKMVCDRREAGGGRRIKNKTPHKVVGKRKLGAPQSLVLWVPCPLVLLVLWFFWSPGRLGFWSPGFLGLLVS